MSVKLSEKAFFFGGFDLGMNGVRLKSLRVVLSNNRLLTRLKGGEQMGFAVFEVTLEWNHVCRVFSFAARCQTCFSFSERHVWKMKSFVWHRAYFLSGPYGLESKSECMATRQLAGLEQCQLNCL